MASSGLRPRAAGLRHLTALIAGIALLATMSVTATAAVPGARPPAPAGPVATVTSSHIVLQVKADPHAAIVRTTNALAPTSKSISTSGTFGSASASRAASTTTMVAGGAVTVHTTGTLTAKAHCAPADGCPGDVLTAGVYAAADASIRAQIGMSGDIPYRLSGTIAASGTSISPCANISVGVVGDTEIEHHEVYGPIAGSDDPDCLTAKGNGDPAAETLHASGILHASTNVTFAVTADTSFIDPGTRRTDSLKATWNLTLVLGPVCTVSAADLPSYDPLVGAVLDGTSGNDVICGGDGPDTIHGNGGTDQVFGGAGGDRIEASGTLDGGDGADTICGSAAADTIRGGNGGDVIAGGPGADVIDGGFDEDLIVADNGPGDSSLVFIVGCAGVTPVGAAAVDHVSGGPGHDEIHGGGGNDVLSGDAGDDQLEGDGGADTIRGGTGADKIHGGDGGDLIVGGGGRDVLSGNAGNDDIHGVDGLKDSVFCGGGSADTAELDAKDVRSGCEATTNLR